MSQYLISVDQESAQRFWQTFTEVYKAEVRSSIWNHNEGKVMEVIIEKFRHIREAIVGDKASSCMASTLLQ